MELTLFRSPELLNMLNILTKHGVGGCSPNCWLCLQNYHPQCAGIGMQNSLFSISFDSQSIVTVTFEVPGNTKEENLNIFIQVCAVVTVLMMCCLSGDKAMAVVIDDRSC